MRFTINTDGPYLLDTDMKTEIQLLLAAGILSEDEVDQCLLWARESTFVDLP